MDAACQLDQRRRQDCDKQALTDDFSHVRRQTYP
jgi:hypothetical protein